MKNTFTVAKFLTVVLALAVGVALWWVMRPSFIHEEDAHGYCCTDETCQHHDHDAAQEKAVQPEVAAPAPSKPCCAKLEETKPCCAHLDEKQPEPAPKDEKKNSKSKPSTKVIAEVKAPAEKPAAVPGKVLVTNAIEKKMLGYHKFGTHYPTTFKVTVGKDTIPQGGTCTATPSNNAVCVRYDFEFMNGYRNGAAEVTFNLKPGTEALTLTWDWKAKNRLFVAEADKVVSIVEKDVPYQK